MSEPTPQQQKNLETTVRGFAAFSPENFQPVLDRADENVEIYASDDLANSGRFHGHDGFIEWATQWFDAWEDYKIDVKNLEPVGERHVVVTVVQSALGKGSGVPVEMNAAFMIETNDGEKFTALHLYTSRDEAVKIAEEREASAG